MNRKTIREDLASLLDQAVAGAQARGLLPATALPASPIERPANPEHGDYASTLPLKLARSAGMKPRDIAEILSREFPQSAIISQVTIAGPGFLNFTLNPSWLAEQVNRIVAEGEHFGEVDLGQGATVIDEFVSANPTGPLVVPSGRGGAIGDSLSRILGKAGFRETREYYVNDHGSRIDVFGQSIFARYAQEFGQDVAVPADGYHGEYLVDLAKEVKATAGDRYLHLPPDDAARQLATLGVEYYLAEAKNSLNRMRVFYNDWFSEASLYKDDEVAKIIDMLRAGGHVAEREGAVWFVSSTLGEDKDNVLIRSNGEPTYFASDIAYHYNKLVMRGFDRSIDVWGADHQGHVSRLRTAMAALGLNPDRLQILIHQMVTLEIDGHPVRMSKRSGNVITLAEVLDDVGADACRYFFVSRSADTHLNFDLGLAKKESDENPVYYIQYAHARATSILLKAGDLDWQSADVNLLTHPSEQALIRKMLELPEVVTAAATTLE
ncbi:MAG TPA: arginine--tRNA ligase, partial [Chloroflexota bacterium]|nr:arginine--tRNA ligase [Chloroflexota bacterium]